MQRSYLPSGADLHSVYVHPWGDLSRNRTDLGTAGSRCSVVAFGNRTVCEENQKDALIEKRWELCIPTSRWRWQLKVALSQFQIVSKKGSPPLIGMDFLLHFLSRRSKLHFCSLDTHLRRKYGEFRGENPL